ncbi:dipeptidase [Allosphingosinicella indica]|uniref:Membrane dipeptidase n=1 Tax=Allosphingosinicella indica TaxID=941907 RepID=A0A1X7GIJ8_9SPHN|nr:dipeptidase [Allosphingosinicella indica]SMF69587.1 membrane dipeptidase [Allosphingosinicella indica]
MRAAALLPLAALATTAFAQSDVSPVDRLFHEQMLVLDTHLDTPVLFERPGWRFEDWHDYDFDMSQVDLPRMEAGGLDGGFFVIYTPQGEVSPAGYAKARDAALGRAMAIQRVVAENEGKLALATTADDAERLHRAGKRIVYQSIENSYPLGEDLGLLKTFYDMGVRMAGPVHSKNNQFADSTTDKPRWKGLSPLGRKWVVEMNRLGMVIDGSHSSDATFDDLLALSKTPIILSHSGPRAIYDHPRNLDDARMRKLAAKGGVMQINSVFLGAMDNSDERSAIETRQERWGQLSAEERRALIADKAAQDAKTPYTTADFEMFMKSLLHAISVMGVDHVGLGADWDGGGGVKGMTDIAALPQVTARLREAGIADADIAKIMGGNTLRLLRQAEAAREAR